MADMLLTKYLLLIMTSIYLSLHSSVWHILLSVFAC